MKITKKTFISFSIILLFCLIQAGSVLGIMSPVRAGLWDEQVGMTGADEIGETFGVVAGDTPTDFREMIGKIISVFLGFLGVIFVILMLWGGWKWMTSQGNEGTIDEAKSLIKAAVIGLAIIVMSYGIAQAIMNYVYDISVDP